MITILKKRDVLLICDGVYSDRERRHINPARGALVVESARHSKNEGSGRHRRERRRELAQARVTQPAKQRASVDALGLVGIPCAYQCRQALLRFSAKGLYFAAGAVKRRAAASFISGPQTRLRAGTPPDRAAPPGVAVPQPVEQEVEGRHIQGRAADERQPALGKAQRQALAVLGLDPGVAAQTGVQQRRPQQTQRHIDLGPDGLTMQDAELRLLGQERFGHVLRLRS